MLSAFCWITGDGRRCQFTSGLANACQNQARKFRFISKKRPRSCSIVSRKRRTECLVIRIQPDEGISLRMEAKVPGTSFRIESVKMDFHYGTSFGKASPGGLRTLVLDAMAGDATLFARRDEVEQAWAFVDTIEEAWADEGKRSEVVHLSCGFVGAGGS